MNEPLAALRADAANEVGQLEPSERESAHDEVARVDDLFAMLGSSSPPSDAWMAVIDELALSGPVVNRPDGAAALAAQLPRAAKAISVEAALRVPTGEARERLQEAFGLGRDAADELLERPAAALAQRPPQAVRTLAGLVGRSVGELFDDIASSMRASSGYVYAYRPGDSAAEPAVSQTGKAMADLIEWGVALLS